MDFVYSIFVNLALLIDELLIKINGLLFEVFLKVANARFPESFFNDFVKNLYVIIGIFMIFKVSFSLIQMLANPDMLADKEKGAGKLASRIVITFAIIIMLPTIFDMAYGLQFAILEDGLIGRLMTANQVTTSDQVVNNGKLMAVDIFKGMVDLNEEIDKTNIPADAQKCYARINSAYSSSSGLDLYDSSTTMSTIRDGGNDIDCFTDKIDSNGTEVRPFEYRFIVSTIALGLVAWLMVGFCIDIGTRLIKLSFLELLAPVCAATYIGGGKDNIFNKWMKMTISAFVTVFVKLIIIYFIVYIAGSGALNNITTYVPGNPQGEPLGGLAMVCAILGLLVFAQNATKLFSELFGIQAEEGGGFKGIAKAALLGGAAMTAAGGLGGLSNIAKGVGNTASAMGKAKTAKGKLGALGLGTLSTLGSGLAGTTSGAFHGARNGFSKNASLGGSINKALMTSRTNRDNRADRKSVYGGTAQSFLYNNIVDRIRGFAGIDTKAKGIVNQTKNTGAGLNRAQSNILHAQGQVAQRLSVPELQILDNYSYNAFDNEWSYFDGKDTHVLKNDDGSNMSYDDITSTGHWTDDEARYLKYTEQASNIEKRIIDNNKLQSKAQAQQARMEGSNGKNA